MTTALSIDLSLYVGTYCDRCGRANRSGYAFDVFVGDGTPDAGPTILCWPCAEREHGEQMKAEGIEPYVDGDKINDVDQMRINFFWPDLPDETRAAIMALANGGR